MVHSTRLRWLAAAVLLAVAHSGTVIAAQAPPSLTGRVLDAFSRRPVIGAAITAGPTVTVTDRDGRFTLALPHGAIRLIVEADGYLREEVDIVVAAQPISVEVLLVGKAQFKEDVVVTAGFKPAAPSPATIDVRPIDVRGVAGGAENIFRTLQTLPGVAATEDFGSRLTVRGGSPDQNLTVMDGVEIHNPYRLFGLTSAFNPETVEHFELLAGGFGVKYGDRLSSILLIENRPGTKQESFAGSAAAALTDTNVVVEGKLPGRMNGSWLVTGRRTYYDLIANRITGEDLPTFGDVQTRLVWEMRPGQRLAVSALRSRERTDAQFDSGPSDSSFGLGDTSSNDLVSAAWSSTFGARVSSKTVASWYRYRDELDAAGDLRDESVRSNAPGEDAFGRATVGFGRDLGVRDVSIRQELALSLGATHVVEVGGEAHVLTTQWGWSITGDRNTNEANGSSALGGSGLPSLLDSRQRSLRAGAWVLDRVRLASRVTVEPGIRFDRGGLDRDIVVSPRLAATILPGGGITMRGAVGLFTQSPGYEKLLQSDYFVDLTSARDLRLQSERALHVLWSVEKALATGVTGRIEAYYKSFDRLIVGRLESPEETAARVALYDFPAELASSVPTAPTVTSEPVNGAKGRAYGFDVYVARRPLHATDRLSGWASYTWGRASIDNYGRRYPLDYDRRHAGSLVGTYRVWSWLDVAATVRVASGFPYTPVRGLRVSAAAEPGSAGLALRYVPERDAQGRYRWTTDPGGVDTLNSAVLPTFARVDLRTTFRPSWSRHRWQFYVEVINLLNRKNAGSIGPQLTYDPAGDRPALSQVRREGIPLLPSAGIRLRF